MSNVTQLKTTNQIKHGFWTDTPRTTSRTPAAPRGNNLRKLRIAAGLTLEEATKDMGICKYTLMNWEIGKSKPRRNNFVRMAECYRVHHDQPKWASNKEEHPYTQIKKLHLMSHKELCDLMGKCTTELQSRY